MAATDGQPPGGISYKGSIGQVTASDDTVTKALATLERMWARALDWSSAFPSQFYALLLLIAFALYLRHKESVQIAALKGEYKERRDRERSRQPSFSFPDSEGRETEGD